MVKKNLALAQIVLDIAAAQYNPEKSKKSMNRRFRIRGVDETIDSNQEPHDPDEIALTSELVDDEFTIEDLAALSASAGSETSPRDLIMARTPWWVVHYPLTITANDIHRGDSEVWKPGFYWSTYQSPMVGSLVVLQRSRLY